MKEFTYFLFFFALLPKYMYNIAYERKFEFMNKTVASIFAFLLIIVIIWFTYTITNIIVTIFRCRKLDHSLSFCFNSKGKIFYIILTILYVGGFIGGLITLIYGFLNDKTRLFLNGINVAAFVSVVYAYFLSSLVLVGRKNMMVGRMMIDYRKLKKVNFTFTNKMSFVYAQKDYNFSTRFIDITKLRKMISR